jgi:predicted transcriptional regulator
MTDKQEVIEALNAMPETVSLDEIIEELRIMAAVRRGRAAIAAGRTKTQQEVRQLVESWAESWANANSELL